MVKVTKTKKRGRAALKPHLIRYISEHQLDVIIQSANPSIVLSAKEREQFVCVINRALAGLSVPIDQDKLPDMKIVYEALRKLKAALSAQNIWCVRATGRAFRRFQEPMEFSHGLTSYDTFCDNADRAVSEFVKTTDVLLDWLKDPSHADQVLASLKPADKVENFLITDLREIYEAIFKKAFGTGRTGPGIRFIMGVLRASRIRSDSDPDETIAEMIVQAGRRAKSINATAPRAPKRS
jgi:hypothetical protein